MLKRKCRRTKLDQRWTPPDRKLGCWTNFLFSLATFFIHLLVSMESERASLTYSRLAGECEQWACWGDRVNIRPMVPAGWSLKKCRKSEGTGRGRWRRGGWRTRNPRRLQQWMSWTPVMFGRHFVDGTTEADLMQQFFVFSAVLIPFLLLLPFPPSLLIPFFSLFIRSLLRWPKALLIEFLTMRLLSRHHCSTQRCAIFFFPFLKQATVW